MKIVNFNHGMVLGLLMLLEASCSNAAARGNASQELGAFQAAVGGDSCLANGMDTTQPFQTTVTTAAELNGAVVCANDNVDTQDTIYLGGDITLVTAEVIDGFGATGVQTVLSPITLDGQNYKLERGGAACNLNGNRVTGEFRLLHVSNAGHLRLRHIELKGGCADGAANVTSEGGAILSNGNASVDSVYFNNNQANSGGAIANINATIGHVSRSFFYKNIANLNGGAILNQTGDVGPIRYSSFIENEAHDGGALHTRFSALHEITNNTFTDNVANSHGSAIHSWNGLLPHVSNNTFHSNSSDAIYHNSSAQPEIFTNNLFVSNIPFQPGEDADCFGSGFVTTIENTGGNYSTEMNSGCQGIESDSLNPNLVGAYTDNGCEVALPGGDCPPTHSLLNGSSAINGSVLMPTPVDQRGLLAVGQRDVGAYEYDASISDLIFDNGFE